MGLWECGSLEHTANVALPPPTAAGTLGAPGLWKGHGRWVTNAPGGHHLCNFTIFAKSLGLL